MRILFLDDDQDLSATMRDVVEAIGEGTHEFIAATSYQQLLELDSRALRTDLAILDINLGENSPSGVDAMDWLRRHNYSGHIVFLTGHARSHPLVIKAALSGGIEILEKPLDLSRLFELIAGHQAA
jgi:DNA-binding NtrC family response regulator